MVMFLIARTTRSAPWNFVAEGRIMHLVILSQNNMKHTLSMHSPGPLARVCVNTHFGLECVCL